MSPGCENCYAETVAARFSGLDPAGKPLPYHGLAVMTEHGPRWTRKVVTVPEHLADPLRWKRPRRIFVNSMSDLFHEGLTNEDIAAIFGVMSAAPRHTFQVLTKRSQRMLDWFAWAASDPIGKIAGAVVNALPDRKLVGYLAGHNRPDSVPAWPLPNVWLGVSAEDQQRADERIPDLLHTPAAVRFVSYEPALGPVDFGAWTRRVDWERGIDWIIVGGESGPGARPFNVQWASSVVDQCRAAGVAPFVKQLGANVRWSYGQETSYWPFGDSEERVWSDGDVLGWHVDLNDGHGGDWSEWPADLRVREFPTEPTP